MIRLHDPHVVCSHASLLRVGAGVHLCTRSHLWAMQAVLPYTALHSLRPPNVVSDAAQLLSASHYSQYGRPEPGDARLLCEP
jgi:hypothetical protein